ncbi:MAG: sodium:solute symporter family protein [Candidatus Eremiobacteraeota bacterium]|nr:sodium:solute symporter family protein [Candidatus Eremiobacteraeota bacterium]
MSPAAIALSIVGAIVFGTIIFALLAVHRLPRDPTQYIVGGRSFGALFLWILLAVEIYTSFTFLGAAGWAYGKSAPAFYILAYGPTAYIISYFLLPPIWRLGKERGLLTSADFFVDRYGSRWLGGAIALLQFVLIVPYVTLQLTGMQILLTLAGYGRYNASIAAGAAFIIIALFVFTAGLRGTAWASVIKDALVLAAVIFAGIVLPIHFFGSPAKMFDRLLVAHPTWLTLQSNGQYPPLWYVTTVILSGVGFYMGPHSIAAVYAAKNGDTLRRNAIFLPLYQILLMLMFFAGFAAILIVPGLRGPAADQSFMLVVQRFYAPWVLGLVAGAGALAALVPVSGQLLGAASVLAKNVLGDLLHVGESDAGRTTATRILVIVIAVFALWLWLEAKTTLVDLLLIYYNGMTQLLPGVVFALIWPRVRAPAVAAGIAAGIVTTILLRSSANVHGLNVGFLALAINLVVCITITVAGKQKTRRLAGSLSDSTRPRLSV